MMMGVRSSGRVRNFDHVRGDRGLASFVAVGDDGDDNAVACGDFLHVAGKWFFRNAVIDARIGFSSRVAITTTGRFSSMSVHSGLVLHFAGRDSLRRECRKFP